MRILMTGGSAEYLAAEARMLKDRGFLVYTCNEQNIDDAIPEIKPDVVFIHPENPGLDSTRVYHELLDNIRYASVPVVYTLAEDDVYLVNRKRTASRERRNLIADNIIDGIKYALLTEGIGSTRKARVSRTMQIPTYAFRA